MEIAHPGKLQKNQTPENTRKIRFEKCQSGNWTPCKIPGWKMHNLKNTRMEIAHPWKWQKNHTRKITKCIIGIYQNEKMHTLENIRMEIEHPRKWQKNQIWKMPEWKFHILENTRMANVQPWKYQNRNGMLWKWQKNHNPEQSGKYTPLKIPENKLHTLENDRKITPREKLSFENNINHSSLFFGRLLFNIPLQSIFKRDKWVTLHSSLFFSQAIV